MSITKKYNNCKQSRKRVQRKRDNKKTRKNIQKGGLSWPFSSGFKVDNFDDTPNNIKKIKDILEKFVRDNSNHVNPSTNLIITLKTEKHIFLNTLIKENKLIGRKNETITKEVYYSNLMQFIDSYEQLPKIKQWVQILKLFDQSENIGSRHSRIFLNKNTYPNKFGVYDYKITNSGILPSNQIATLPVVDVLFHLLNNSNSNVSKFAEVNLAKILLTAGTGAQITIIQNIEQNLGINGMLSPTPNSNRITNSTDDTNTHEKKPINQWNYRQQGKVSLRIK